MQQVRLYIILACVAFGILFVATFQSVSCGRHKRVRHYEPEQEDSDGDLHNDPTGDSDRERSLSFLASALFSDRPKMLGCPKLLVRWRIGQNSLVFYSPYEHKDFKVPIRKGLNYKAVQTLTRHGFNISQPSVIYAHGWKESVNSEWLMKIRDQYRRMFPDNVKKSTFNLLFFDWEDVARMRYTKAARTVPNIGKALAAFLETFDDNYHYPMSNYHLVGYSLSAHIMGKAGQILKQEGRVIRQITAIDPAGPCFFSNTPFARDHTLTADSAKLVVARHYSFGTFGATNPIGHVDIYINGGKPIESKLGWFSPGLTSHMSAATHESELVSDGECMQVAYQCPNYELFNAGLCATCYDNQKNRICYTLETMAKASHKFPTSNFKHGTKMYAKMSLTGVCLYQYQAMALLRNNATVSILSAFQAKQVGFEITKGMLVYPYYNYSCKDYKIFTVLALSKTRLLTDQIRTKGNIPDLVAFKLNYLSDPTVQGRANKSTTFCPEEDNYLSTEACSEKITRYLC